MATHVDKRSAGILQDYNTISLFPPFLNITVHDKLFDRKIWKNLSFWKRRKQANMRSFQAVQYLNKSKLHFPVGKMLKYA